MIKFNPTYTKTSYRGVLRPTFVQKKSRNLMGQYYPIKFLLWYMLVSYDLKILFFNKLKLCFRKDCVGSLFS